MRRAGRMASVIVDLPHDAGRDDRTLAINIVPYPRQTRSAFRPPLR